MLYFEVLSLLHFWVYIYCFIHLLIETLKFSSETFLELILVLDF